MKTLKNISVIILFVGLTFLTFYITKSYYVFNDMNYKDIVNKLIAEEKKRTIDSELVRQDKLPTNMFEIMFKKPSPWMGYSDDLTKDFNKKDNIKQKEIDILENKNKENKKKIIEINNKIAITNDMIKENDKEEKKLLKNKKLSEEINLKKITDLLKKQEFIIDDINLIKPELKKLNSIVTRTEPIKNELNEEEFDEYKRKIVRRKILYDKIKSKFDSYQYNKKTLSKLKLDNYNQKDNKSESIILLGKKIFNQKLNLISELSNINKKIEKNNNKIKSINTIMSFEVK